MPKKINLKGKKFGRLTVIKEAPNKGKKTQWECICDCGNSYIGSTESLRAGTLKSCGCLRKEQAQKQSQKNIISLLGQKFGRLTVISQEKSIRGHSAWLCQCDCGNQKIVSSVELKNGDTLSCGCLKSSFGELQIEKILKDNNISFEKEYYFKDLLSENNILLRFDFAIFDNQKKLCRLIEYDGEQHFSKKGNSVLWSDNLFKREQRDNQKNDYCKKNHILLVRVPYWEKNNLNLELLMGEKYLIKD